MKASPSGLDRRVPLWELVKAEGEGGKCKEREEKKGGAKV